MEATITDIVNAMNNIAPESLAEEWDNVGLQAGDSKWTVRKVLVALDPLPEVVNYACDHNYDLLITHHPLLLKLPQKIDFSSGAGSIIYKSAVHRLGIYSAHTNLDSVKGGLNDTLAEKIGVRNLRVLGRPAGTSKNVKLVVYVPAGHLDKVREEMFKSGAGEIGSYSCCTFSSPGKGTFKPGEGSNPYIGEIDKISIEDEYRLETIVPAGKAESVMSRIEKVHPYETVAYDIYPLESPSGDEGIGRVGEIESSVTLGEFAALIKKALDLEVVRISGDSASEVKKVALCTGGGASLTGDFFKSGADVYVTGDMKYHEARQFEEKGLGLIDIGHFASEFIMVELIAGRLGAVLEKEGFKVQVDGCSIEKDSFTTI